SPHPSVLPFSIRLSPLAPTAFVLRPAYAMLPLTEKPALIRAEQDSGDRGNPFTGSSRRVPCSASPAAANVTPRLPACPAQAPPLPSRPPPAQTRDLLSPPSTPTSTSHYTREQPLPQLSSSFASSSSSTPPPLLPFVSSSTAPGKALKSGGQE
ncbi:hypothetical protein E2I00_002750, partial [Balaenoptera physalus]